MPKKKLTDKQHLNKLPKWAQKTIADLKSENVEIQRKFDNLSLAHHILFNYDSWFTLGVFTEETRQLFMLNKDSAQAVCSIGSDTILLVGRKKEEAK